MSEPQLQSTTASPKPSSAGSAKDTIESILIAFILAFVFRAFVVEAFVIPTGSMATTLLGAHTRFHCPDCGYDFDVNYSPPPKPHSSSDPEGDDPAIPAFAGTLDGPIYCPNCGFKMLDDQVKNPPVFYGDRILVLKYLYMLEQPSRFDVVVFKAPMQMTTNYIKRLIGKPGEAIMIVDGDVYVRAPDAKNANDFVIQAKPKAVQDALWRVVYDNDFHPQISETGKRLPVNDWQQPWTVVDGTGWNLNDPATHGRAFKFDGDNSSGRLRFDPQANPTAQSQSEYSVYDQQSENHDLIPPRPIFSRFPVTQTDLSTRVEIPVSDLDLRLTYQRISGNGPLKVSLTKRGHTFTAEITPTKATLYQDFEGKRTPIGSPKPLGSSSAPIRIELSNADYQVTLRINGEVAAQSTPADFSPNMPELLREYQSRKTPPPGSAEIEAAEQHGQVSHLSLWRDNFYYNDRGGVRRATPDAPMVLNADEYFVMGDNSTLSYDARCWENGIRLPSEELDVQAGCVPARFLLGKAFYVYWPAGYEPVSGWPALVPNFGAMRFIH